MMIIWLGESRLEFILSRFAGYTHSTQAQSSLERHLTGWIWIGQQIVEDVGQVRETGKILWEKYKIEEEIWTNR